MESATSELGGKAEEISSKSDIAARESEVEGKADMLRAWLERRVLAKRRRRAESSEFEPQSKTRTSIVGPVATDPNEAIRVNGPARAEVVTDLELGGNWPLLVLPVVGYLGVQLGPVSFAKWCERYQTYCRLTNIGAAVVGNEMLY